jgi:hypothetical protein
VEREALDVEDHTVHFSLRQHGTYRFISYLFFRSQSEKTNKRKGFSVLG